ncbi:hypothetical protein V2J09_021571 [Rumex salicifolius]
MPMSAITQLLEDGGTPLSSPTNQLSCSVRSLQYLSLRRLNVAFSINGLPKLMLHRNTYHWASVKFLLRFLADTPNRGIFISTSSIEYKALVGTTSEFLWVLSLALLFTEPTQTCFFLNTSTYLTNGGHEDSFYTRESG